MSPTPSANATVTAELKAGNFRQGELVADRFRLKGTLGVGGMGVVYLAHDQELDIEVALKLLLPGVAAQAEALERFRRELLLARKISSPQVVRIHDFVSHQGRWLISMDYIDGESLRQWLDRHGPPSLEDALAIARQIALGLEAAHSEGILHRDLKPGNVLINANKRVWITDFGVARSMGASGLTASGTIVGTLEYLSPEQARGVPLDARSDLYALGLILYEMLVGRLPFAAGTPTEMVAQRVVAGVPSLKASLAKAPRWLDRLLAQLLARDPARRPASAAAVVAALQSERTPWQRPKARTLGLAAAALLAAVGLGYGAFHLDTLAPGILQLLPAPRAEVVVLPAQGNDPELNRAIDELLSSDLLASKIDSPDSAQVRRTLTLLGFDGAQAIDHPERVQSALPTQRLIGIAVNAVEQRVDLTLTRYDDDPPRSVSLTGLNGSSLAVALKNLLAQLGIDALEQGPWPTDLEALRTFGAASATARTDTAPLHALLEAQPTFAAAWAVRLRLAASVSSGAALEQLAAAADAALSSVRGRDAELVRAQVQRIRGDFGGAIARLETWLKTRPHDRTARLALGALRDENGEPTAATEAFAAVLSRDPQHPQALLARARSRLRAGNAQDAIDQDLGQALQLHTRLDDGFGRAESLHGLGVAYERLGQAGPATDHFAQAATLREALGDSRGAAASLRNLGYGHGVNGQFELAAAAFEKARGLLVALDDKRGLADLANDEGLIAEEAGDFTRAAARYREVLDLNRALNDPIGSADAALNLGFVFLHSGEYQSARVQLAEADQAYRRAEDQPGQVRAAQKLSMLDVIDGNFGPAEQRLNAALRQAEALQLVEEEAVSLAELADVLRLRGELGQANAALERARVLFEERGDQRGMNEVDLRRARLALSAEQPDAAATILARLIQTAPASVEQQAALALMRAEIELLAGRADAAAALITAGAAAAERSASTPLQITAQLLLAKAQQQRALPTARAELAAAWAQHALHPSRVNELKLLVLEISNVEAGQLSTHDARIELLRPVGWPGDVARYRALAKRWQALGDSTQAAAAERNAVKLLTSLRNKLAASDEP